MRRVKALILLGIISFPVHGAVESGSYVFLYAQLLGCGDKRYVVDYAEVPENGIITVLDGIEISVLGSPKVEIEKDLAEQVGEKTGRTPKTLSVELVPATDSKRIANELMKLSSFVPICARSVEPGPPPPNLDFIRTLANTPPNITFHRPPDVSVTALAYATRAPAAGADVRLIRGFNDEALRGEWKGHRSSRLGGLYRVIYRLEKTEFLVMVVDLTAHDYRRK
jgi:hypothetical protein